MGEKQFAIIIQPFGTVTHLVYLPRKAPPMALLHPLFGLGPRGILALIIQGSAVRPGSHDRYLVSVLQSSMKTLL